MINHNKFLNNSWGVCDADDAPWWMPYDPERAKSWVPLPPDYVAAEAREVEPSSLLPTTPGGAVKSAKCNKCSGEVWFDAWVDIEGNVAGGPYQNTFCAQCGGEAAYTITAREEEPSGHAA